MSSPPVQQLPATASVSCQKKNTKWLCSPTNLCFLSLSQHRILVSGSWFDISSDLCIVCVRVARLALKDPVLICGHVLTWKMFCFMSSDKHPLCGAPPHCPLPPPHNKARWSEWWRRLLPLSLLPSEWKHLVNPTLFSCLGFFSVGPDGIDELVDVLGWQEGK